MGNYNPHAPYILGNEWVPIRQANFMPDKVTEQGYTFHLDHSVTPITGAFYVAEVPQTRVSAVSDMVHVYPAGSEALTGPIKTISIPASAIWVTGAEISASEGYTALNNPSDDQSIRFLGPSDFNTYFGISFDVPSYSQQLFGKRILDVSFRYSIAAANTGELENISVRVAFAKDVFNQGVSVMFQQLEGSITGEKTKVNQFSLGSTNYMWDATRDVYSYFDVYPWRYQELARFAATEPAISRMVLLLTNQLSEDNNAFIYFVDMQVTYCEETRVLYGGKSTTNTSVSTFESNYGQGPNLVRLFNTSFVSNSTALTPGDYTVAISHDDWPTSVSHAAPELKAIRELYPVVQRGIRVDRSLTPDDTFSAVEVPYLTELTLHTASAVVTGVHPYGTQSGAAVYGTITAVQEIEDNPVGTAKVYPQVRFYARRFGDTTVPLTFLDVTTGTFSTSISVAEFDDLPEIVDGWREVTLRFDSPPSFSTAAGAPDWRWQATNELARNQWQVLSAGSQTFAAHSIGPASYYAPFGNTVALAWQSPAISGTAEDALADAVLIFATDPPTVTGFAVETLDQELTTSSNCIVPPRCVPTALQYNHLTWDMNVACDTFTREVTGGWGGDWTTTGDATFFVDGTMAAVQPSTGSTTGSNAVLPNTFTDLDWRSTFQVDQLSLGNSQNIQVTFRRQDSSNYYRIQFGFDTSGTIDLTFAEVTAGTATTLTSLNNVIGYAPDLPIHVRLQVVGTLFSVKVWTGDSTEPIGWILTATDASYTSGAVGVRQALNSGNTNVNPIIYVDDVSVVPYELLESYFEIERTDEITNEWHTIMRSTTACPNSFDDYEARVGVESTYRIRTVNALDFYGSWVTTSATIPAPGVTVSGDGNSVLIFTTNEDPTANLAYVMQFENQAIEEFAFPEASQVELQRMFGKDFFTAFHPLERDGEQFGRVLLVNAAAIALPSLANFRGMRDLAWANVNYVCVRDELGNRWFANVRVPGGTVRMDRTIYLAQVEVSEVTATPTPIEPEVL